MSGIVNLKKLIEIGDLTAVAEFALANGLVLRDGHLVPKDDAAMTACKAKVMFWDQRQQARKILLNSLYGALLNAALRFADERMGQSVTLTGRSIARHMNAKINEVIAGTYDHTGEAICYADTDSSYFSAVPSLGIDGMSEMARAIIERAADGHEMTASEGEVLLGEMLKNIPEERQDERDGIVELYQKVGDAVNESFPGFMDRTFNTGTERGSIIAAGLELVASNALFIKKKKYACLKFWDDDNKRVDKGNAPGKLKAMGLDLKRADTPKFMQAFLERILMDVLQNASEKDILNQIATFRTEFKKRPAWEKGSPKKVQNLTRYRAIKDAQEKMVLYDKKGVIREKKRMIPGHVVASINWNKLLDIYGDKYSMRVTDGSRIIVCRLKANHLRMETVAYPVDEPHLPKWFRDLPFDEKAMEEIIIDKKITNLLGVLKWNLKATHSNDLDDLIKFF